MEVFDPLFAPFVVSFQPRLILWGAFWIALAIVIIFSLVLWYHWTHYAFDDAKVRRVGKLYLALVAFFAIASAISITLATSA